MRDKLILGDKAEYTKNDNTLKIIDNVVLLYSFFSESIFRIFLSFNNLKTFFTFI